jgi:hypothetical protein
MEKNTDRDLSIGVSAKGPPNTFGAAVIDRTEVATFEGALQGKTAI